MNIQNIKPWYCIETEIDTEALLRDIETTARTCYKSEDKIGEGSADILVRNLVYLGHWPMFDHFHVRVRFVCDRGVSHELVRHRLAAYAQESTRYCNYGNKGFQFIIPCFFRNDPSKMATWAQAMTLAAQAYTSLLAAGAKPEEARGVLPNSLKTEIVATMNLRQWRHVFKERAVNPKAHPQMRELMLPLLKEMRSRIPYVFYDLSVEDDPK